MKNLNSTTNQRIKGEFIAKHVYCNLGSMVEELILAHHHNSDIGFELYDYLTPFTYFEGEQINEEQKDEKIQRIETIIDNFWEFNDVYNDIPEGVSKETFEHLQRKTQKLEEIKDELNDLECDEYPEVYEYWGVSNWLGEKLRELGEVVIDEYNTTIWGRTTTGQAILLDYVISQVCSNMEIMEGQQNSWA